MGLLGQSQWPIPEGNIGVVIPRQWPRQILGPLLSKLCDQSRAGCWDADKIGAKVVHFCSIRPVFKNMEGIESQVF